MKNYLSATDLAMWIVLIAGKVVLCLCILKKHFVKRLPCFSALVFASGSRSLASLPRFLGQLFSLLLRFLYRQLYRISSGVFDPYRMRTAGTSGP